MAIFQVLFAALSRQLSKLLNTAFGWATTLLFGKVPADRQIYLSLINFGSVLWLIVVLGIAFPRFGAFLLTFATLPSWIQPAWIRVAMLLAAVLIPLGVGLVSTRLEDSAAQGKGRWKRILRGYPATVGLAVTLLLLTVFAPLIQLRQIARRWTAAHVPVIVESSEYLTVVAEIQDALRGEGLETTRQSASWMMRFPTKLLTLLASGTINNLVADKLTVLVAPKLEVMLHPADLVISGPQKEVDGARQILAERLMFSDANLTWTKEANDIEDRLNQLWDSMSREPGPLLLETAPHELAAITEDLRNAKLEYEEWQVLHRIVLAADRAILAVAAGAVEHPTELLTGDKRLGSLKLRRKHEPSDTENRVVKALSAAAVLALAVIARKSPEGREMIGKRDLVGVARLGIRASSDRKAA